MVKNHFCSLTTKDSPFNWAARSGARSRGAASAVARTAAVATETRAAPTSFGRQQYDLAQLKVKVCVEI